VERRLCFAVLYRDVVTDSERLLRTRSINSHHSRRCSGLRYSGDSVGIKAMRGSAPSSSGVQFSSLSVPEVSPGGSKLAACVP